MHEEQVLSLLEDQGIRILATLPCDKTRALFSLMKTRFCEVGLSREEDGVGVCAGAALAGKRAAMVIQSSGLGNSLNAIMSLSRTYGLPLPILASWRGVYRESIPAQVPFNRPLPRVLEALDIPCNIVSDEKDLDKIRETVSIAFRDGTPAVALVSPELWGEEDRSPSPPFSPPRARKSRLVYERDIREPEMTRFEAIKYIARNLSDQAVISNIGFPSRELYAAGDRDLNFYMLGSYTQASPIGLGVSLSTDRDVYVLDGDGSILGTAILPVIAGMAPENLTVFCLDNGAFGSTGNQETPAARQVDLEVLALASGFIHTEKVQDEGELEKVLSSQDRGPRFIHVIIRPGNAATGDIPLTPRRIRDRFMSALGTG